MQKPQVVIEAVNDYLSQDYANIHRGNYELSRRSEELYEKARGVVARFIKASDTSEVIFTSSSTDSVNLLARSLYRSWMITKDDNIVLTTIEHHANLVPWQMISELSGCELRWIDVWADWVLDVNKVLEKVDTHTKIVALSACSNVTGRLWTQEIRELCEKIDPLVVVDASQAVVHSKVDVVEMGCDFMFFTGHKLGALTWIGVLRGKKEILKELKPGKVWGGAVEQVTTNGAAYLWSPDRFEPGTPNVVGAISLEKAIEYMERISGWVDELVKYCLEEFTKLEKEGKITLLWGHEKKNKIGVFSFIVHCCTLSEFEQRIQEANIALRTWAHCTHIYHYGLDESDPEKSCLVKTARISLGMYNMKQDVETFFEVMKEL